MTRDAEIIKSNLEVYPFIKCYLGDIIQQRLSIAKYDSGILTASLLSANNKYNDNLSLDMLENALTNGKRLCTNFDNIFQNVFLSLEMSEAERQIADTIAEVKVTEILVHYPFADITKVISKQDSMTVDFTATRNNQHYAVEVTRLGIPKSDRKKPELEKAPVIMIDSKNPKNISRFIEDIYDEVLDKYTQIKEFCQLEKGTWKGVLAISRGRDYFLGRHDKKLYELQPMVTCKAPEQVWMMLKETEISYEYLNHIVLIRDKCLDNVIIYPSFETEE